MPLICRTPRTVHASANRLLASGEAPGLAQRKQLGALETALDLAEAAHAGDPDARALYAETGKVLGICLAGPINILNLPLYVIGGGVANSRELLAPSIF